MHASQLSTTGQGFSVTLPWGLGVSALAAADVNGDGIADLLIGSSQAWLLDFAYAPVFTYTGAVFVVFGKSGIADVDLETTPLTGSNGFTIVGGTGTKIGRAIAVGDVNGDGMADIVISGRPQYGTSGYDGVFIIFGGPTINLPAVNNSGLHLMPPLG